MTLKRRARDARFSTRRLDPNGRTGRRRRRRHEVQIDWVAAPKTPRFQQDFDHAQKAERWLASEAETGHESVDELHPRDA